MASETKRSVLSPKKTLAPPGGGPGRARMPVGGGERKTTGAYRAPGLHLTPMLIMAQNGPTVYGGLPYLLPGKHPIFMVGYASLVAVIAHDGRGAISASPR